MSGASVLAAAAIAAGLSSLPACGVEIAAFESNGTLSWDDTNGGGTYAVEWATSPAGPWHSWQDAVESLTAIQGTGGRMTVSVPLFYRVVTPDPAYDPTQRYTYFEELPELALKTPLEPDEMRITFMGTMIPLPPRRAQAEVSIFVEVGWIPDAEDEDYGGRAVDQFVFDCGAGVSANYAAANVGFRRMDKVLLTHLHGDHMNDLTHIYTFGPAGDRKSPLFVWGPSPSGVESPEGSMKYYDDGTRAFCENLRRALRWHSESFSFQRTRYESYEAPTRESWGLPVYPIPVDDDTADDAYAMIPIELDWTKSGKVPGDNIAYDNPATGVKITHFPVIHARRGSIGYKLEWNGLSMIFTGDTKPETNSVHQACNGGDGVDVFIHEMVVPPAVWAYKNMGLNAAPEPGDDLYPEFAATVDQMTMVQNSSHTTQGAFGYLLSQIDPPPRLAVATHFPVADDTVASALQSVRAHCPDIRWGEDITWAFDLMVLRVFPDRIEQRRSVVSDFSFNPPVQIPDDTLPAKYRDENDQGDPYAQIEPSAEIPPVDPVTGEEYYREDGY